MAQYLILIYSDEQEWEALSPEQTTAAHERYLTFWERNAAVITGGSQLAPTTTATAIRSDGADGFVVTDGAFVETKEALGGYYLIDVASLDEALEVAKQVPIVAGGIEVRPLTESGM